MRGRGCWGIARMLSVIELYLEKEPFWWIIAHDQLSDIPSHTGHQTQLPIASTAPRDSWPVTDPFGMPW